MENQNDADQQSRVDVQLSRALAVAAFPEYAPEVVARAHDEFTRDGRMLLLTEHCDRVAFEDLLENTALAEVESCVLKADCSLGREAFNIPVIGAQACILEDKFVYLSLSSVYSQAKVNFTIGEALWNRCNSAACRVRCSSVDCACHMYTGVSAYNNDGVLYPQFLQNCVLMKGKVGGGIPFIKECWVACNCDINCGNRVVQRGIQKKLEVYKDHDGFCIRTDEHVPAGCFLFEYVGEIVNDCELKDRLKAREERRKVLEMNWREGERRKHIARGESMGRVTGFHVPPIETFGVPLNIFQHDEEQLHLDATNMANLCRYLRVTEQDENVIEIPVLIENDSINYYHLAFFAKFDLPTGTILLWDGGGKYSEAHDLEEKLELGKELENREPGSEEENEEFSKEEDNEEVSKEVENEEQTAWQRERKRKGKGKMVKCPYVFD